MTTTAPEQITLNYAKYRNVALFTMAVTIFQIVTTIFLTTEIAALQGNKGAIKILNFLKPSV